MVLLSSSEKDTQKIAENFASVIKKGDVVALYGELGSGKTTFTRYFVKALGVNSRVQSPTFVIHRIYSGKFKINHLDLYRLTSIEDINELELNDTFKDSVTLIEWPEIAERVLPTNTRRVRISYISENERRFEICE